MGPVGRILRPAGTAGEMDRLHLGRGDPAVEPGRATVRDRRVPDTARSISEDPDEPGSADVRAGRGMRAAAVELARAAPRPAFRAVGAQLLPARGARCACGRGGDVQIRGGGIRRHHLE